MMARKLSVVARCASSIMLFGASLISGRALSEDAIQVTEPNKVFENPFATSELKPRIVNEEPQSAPRSPIVYQNPFATTSKSPPTDKSLRPGPVSRWQHPVIPHHEP
ncbi:MAG TPA: hypothetical protein VHU84_11450, partial [Lacipirellulaceae bacterium]|nr:hypothetical protein [Lacipirellulaceae bacterium]